MTNVDPSGWKLSAVIQGDKFRSVVRDVTASEAYVDDNSETLVLEASDGEDRVDLILDRDAAERLNERLNEVLQ